MPAQVVERQGHRGRRARPCGRRKHFGLATDAGGGDPAYAPPLPQRPDRGPRRCQRRQCHRHEHQDQLDHRVASGASGCVSRVRAR
ncbi:hypothetical protein WQ56_11565 [Luteimonas sp. FCS-9]|nr:hypothetical protein WQ56_11565 [Luteimonas sp. FCS-9]